MQAGDSAAAFEWFREAARRPDAPPELIQAVRGLLPGGPEQPRRASKSHGRKNQGSSH